MDATALKLRATVSSFAPASDAFLEVRFRKTFEAAAIGIGICDLEGRIVEANSALARLLGYERLELVGIDLWKDPWKVDGGEAEGTESERPELAATESSYARVIDELPRREGESFVLEKQCQRRDGLAFWGRLTASLALDDRGQPAFLVMFLEDASDRRRMEEHLRQAEKMAAIGQLAGGVAHDFNNLLTGILLYCDLLIPELELGGPLHRYVEEIRLATEQGAALTQQLLALARREGLDPHAVDINEVALGMENLLRRLIGEQIELSTALEAAGTVVADATQLRQILLNLVLNARDALGPGKIFGGQIRVSTQLAEWPPLGMKSGKKQPPLHSATKNPAPVEVPPQPTKIAPSGGPGLGRAPHRGALALLLTVEDNGCGMSAETCGHLFEPFFTTKKAGQGTGIGLGIVQRIVRELGGKVVIDSAAGSGTRVEVFLPVAGERKRATPCQGVPSRGADVRDSDTQALNSKVEENKGGSPC